MNLRETMDALIAATQPLLRPEKRAPLAELSLAAVPHRSKRSVFIDRVKSLQSLLRQFPDASATAADRERVETLFAAQLLRVGLTDTSARLAQTPTGRAFSAWATTLVQSLRPGAEMETVRRAALEVHDLNSRYLKVLRWLARLDDIAGEGPLAEEHRARLLTAELSAINEFVLLREPLPWLRIKKKFDGAGDEPGGLKKLEGML